MLWCNSLSLGELHGVKFIPFAVGSPSVLTLSSPAAGPVVKRRGVGPH